MERWSLHTLSMGMEKGAVLENSLECPQKVQHRVTQDYTSKYGPKGYENMNTQKLVHESLQKYYS